MSKAIVHAALSAAHTYGEKVAALRKLYRRKSPEFIRAALLPDVASFSKYRVTLVPGAGKAEGTMVLDSEHANYEACRKALGRLVSDIVGEVHSKIEAPDLVAQALRLIGKMTAAQRRKVRAAL
jgi:hypothetical protein